MGRYGERCSRYGETASLLRGGDARARAVKSYFVVYAEHRVKSMGGEYSEYSGVRVLSSPGWSTRMRYSASRHEIWGDMGRYGEIRGDTGRYGEIWGGAPGRCTRARGTCARTRSRAARASCGRRRCRGAPEEVARGRRCARSVRRRGVWKAPRCVRELIRAGARRTAGVRRLGSAPRGVSREHAPCKRARVREP